MPHNEGKTPEEIAAWIAEIAAKSRKEKKPVLSGSDIDHVKRQVLDAVEVSLDKALAPYRD